MRWESYARNTKNANVAVSIGQRNPILMQPSTINDETYSRRETWIGDNSTTEMSISYATGSYNTQ